MREAQDVRLNIQCCARCGKQQAKHGGRALYECPHSSRNEHEAFIVPSPDIKRVTQAAVNTSKSKTRHSVKHGDTQCE